MTKASASLLCLSLGFAAAAACSSSSDGGGDPPPVVTGGKPAATGGKAGSGTGGGSAPSSGGQGGPASGGSSATGGATPPATGGSSETSDAAPAPSDASGPGNSDDAPAGGPPGAGGPDPIDPATPAPTNLADHKSWKAVKMDTTAAGANVAGPVNAFPVAVALDATNFDFDAAKERGEDLRFTKADGTTLLPYTIEAWDKAGKKALVWVKADVLGNSAAQEFRMHWGNPAAGSAADSKAVFNMADGFLGVWHLNEDGNTTADGYRDASSYGAHGTGMNLTPGSRVDARLGKGTQLANSKADWKGQWVKVDGPKVADMYNAVGHPISASIWAKANSFPGHSTIGGYETVFSKGDTSWTLQRFSFNKTWEACTKGPGNVTWHNCAVSKAPIATGQWFHFMMVLADSGLTLYINGVRDSGTGNGKRTSPHAFGIGQQTQVLMGKREWDGVLDEARVMMVARDANWAKLDYESQKEGSKFLTFGAVQTK